LLLPYVLPPTLLSSFPKFVCDQQGLDGGHGFSLGQVGIAFLPSHHARFGVAINHKWEHFRSIGDLGDPFWKP
jgi:hypothetical protein